MSFVDVVFFRLPVGRRAERDLVVRVRAGGAREGRGRVVYMRWVSSCIGRVHQRDLPYGYAYAVGQLLSVVVRNKHPERKE